MTSFLNCEFVLPPSYCELQLSEYVTNFLYQFQSLRLVCPLIIRMDLYSAVNLRVIGFSGHLEIHVVGVTRVALWHVQPPVN